MIVAGNWKLNKNPDETRAFFSSLVEKLDALSGVTLAFFPPAVDIAAAKESLKGAPIYLGGQNCFYENEGAFTGETSPKTLFDMGCTHCLVGHSERRQIFNESDEWIAKKIKACQDAGLTPVLCIGETLEQRESGQTKEVALGQLQKGLELVDWKKPLWVAYEPVWAIGTGKVATPGQAEEVHADIRRFLDEKLGQEDSQVVPILYGGSVKPGNAAELGSQAHIDGFLVGGASLKVESIIGIAQA